MRSRAVYSRVVAAESPERAIADLTDADLEELIEETFYLESPNEFELKIYAMAMVRVLVRWKKLIRV